MDGSMSATSITKEIDNFNNTEVAVIPMTATGSDGIELREAKHVMFLGYSWNPNQHNQVIGRARRLGNPHSEILVWYFG